jgi:hypothetical protein
MKKIVTVCCCFFTMCGLLKASDYDEMQKIVASDRYTNDQFGYMVSISDDYAIVAANRENNDAGAAYIYKRDGATWTEEAKLVAPNRAEDDWFGCSVDLSGDYAIVGAYYKNDTGVAYIFKREGTSWNLDATLLASDRASADRFGYPVSISGDYVVVGAFQEDEGASGGSTLSNAGSAYIFKRDGTSWSQEAKLVASDREAGDNFGTSADISGDYVLIGAQRKDDNAGAAYIFKRDGTSWNQEAKLEASDRASDDHFSFSSSLQGDYAIIGAFLEDEDASGNNTLDLAGSAYIFKRDGTSWNQEAKLVASDRTANDFFGSSVSIFEDYAVVGAYQEGDALGSNTMSKAGSAYIFKRNGSSWSQETKIVSSDRAENDNFGKGVAICNSYAIVGSWHDDEDASGLNYKSGAGSAYIFDKPASQAATPITLASFSAEANAGVVELNWSTESETENSHFLIYRNDEVIASVDGAGTSCETHNYNYTDDQVIPGTHVYAISDVSYAGVEKMQSSIEVVVSSETQNLEDFTLLDAYPNPFNPSITLSMSYGTGSNSVVNIYNTQGELVEQLLNGFVDAGTYNIIWNASEMPSGVYIVNMIAGNYNASQKIVLMK